MAIKFSGINHSDAKTRTGLRGEILFPKIISHNDGTGIVTAIGSRVRKELKTNSITLITEALKSNILKPFIHKIYPLEKIVEAHQEVEKRNLIGQVLLKIR